MFCGVDPLLQCSPSCWAEHPRSLFVSTLHECLLPRLIGGKSCIIEEHVTWSEDFFESKYCSVFVLNFRVSFSKFLCLRRKISFAWMFWSIIPTFLVDITGLLYYQFQTTQFPKLVNAYYTCKQVMTPVVFFHTRDFIVRVLMKMQIIQSQPFNYFTSLQKTPKNVREQLVLKVKFHKQNVRSWATSQIFWRFADCPFLLPK